MTYHMRDTEHDRRRNRPPAEWRWDWLEVAVIYAAIALLVVVMS